MNASIRQRRNASVMEPNRRKINTITTADSADARSWNELSASHGNGRNNTVTAPIGSLSGLSELLPCEKDEPPFEVRAVSTSSWSSIASTDSLSIPRNFAPAVTVKTTRTPTRTIPAGRARRLLAPRPRTLPTRYGTAAATVTKARRCGRTTHSSQPAPAARGTARRSRPLRRSVVAHATPPTPTCITASLPRDDGQNTTLGANIMKTRNRRRLPDGTESANARYQK